MDEILSALGRLLGRLIGRNLDCGLDCDVSQMGWAEYLLLIVILVISIVVTRKIINYFKK